MIRLPLRSYRLISALWISAVLLINFLQFIVRHRQDGIGSRVLDEHKRQPALNFSGHYFQGSAQPVLVIPVIPVDQKENGGYPDHQE